MLEFSQILLFASTLIVALAFGIYVMATFVARNMSSAKQSATVAAPTSASAVVVESNVTSTETQVQPMQARGLPRMGNLLEKLAFLTLTASVIVRYIATGEPPLANQYEFATAFVWGMLAFQIYFEHRYRIRTLALFTLPVILGMLIYVTSLDFAKEPLMPALQNSPLLTLHVFTAALSYGAAVIGFGAAIMYLLAPKVTWRGWPRPEILEELGYKSVVFAFPLLTIMIVLGAIWGNIAWGRYWGWDPKETSALVTWLIYGAYVHARVVRGWRGRKSAWLLVLGFSAVLFTFFGNLWFDSLHSYA
ncbi:c-type cytochrome biogenesis protein CcsB [Trueperella sp. HMSC08B05]|uniref:Cytochrome c biogenesis protein CcsA n=1 Tax=Trueperella bernardiae TaxID=59561 RepID=A0A0W1KIK2_9ACTO|nr:MULTISPECIES: cytochrome c biogenesis protein CcsA [Trueperella]KTF03848.1 Cytochrome c biogenesis protein CcsA [Trueperella bernardiae]OFS65620.1 c-type cytochrome biogenesis protein CcsB [Trueperella sp. HMSC08H06]OFS72006.1 c-type cytochrome biogenesis protein CcsB [Trueperella sp. HMSC08B05]WIM07236.1 cytochrome c biogenesis protein CcsA [Trueperella bernardiae]